MNRVGNCVGTILHVNESQLHNLYLSVVRSIRSGKSASVGQNSKVRMIFLADARVKSESTCNECRIYSPSSSIDALVGGGVSGPHEVASYIFSVQDDE